ncbi:MAG: efflux RND transporter periplasmic adaptor subunit [bacterium]
MKKKKIILSASVVIILAAGWILSYINRPVAEVCLVKKGEAVAAVYGTVKVDWSWSVMIRAENAGFIQFAPGIDAGQTSIGALVKKGQLLATIVDEQTSHSMQQAKTDLQAARNRRDVGPLSMQLLRNALNEQERLKKLSASNQNISQSEIEKASYQVKQLEDQVRAEQIELDRVVETLEQNFKFLQERLDKREVRAPMDGVLIAVNCVEDDLVPQNQPLFGIAKNDTYAHGQVSEEHVGDLKPGMEAFVRLYAYSGREFLARISLVQPLSNPSTQRYTVILKLDNPPPNLMAGMTGEMNIILGRRDNALLIPARALRVDQVLIVKNGVVKAKKVEVGYRSLEKAEILQGVNEGEQVIVSDHDLYRPGQRVRVDVVD